MKPEALMKTASKSQILALPLLAVLGAMSAAGAAETTGGVNWLDTLGYTKPAFVPVAVPNESTVANKYYVDFSSGSGTACTQSAPCKDIANVAGKPGTTGGPAYIYLKGAGRLVMTGSLYGSAGNEVVVKPWPGATQTVTMTNNGSGSTGGANIISGTGVHHVVVDGGPDLLFDFTSVANSGQNGYVLIVSANDITIARSRVRQANGSGPNIGHAAGGGTWSRVRYVNNEIYDNTKNLTGAAYAFYLGGGATCSPPNPTTGYNDLTIENNLIRNIAGNGIMGEPRGLTANGTTIKGNVFRTIGNGQNRSAIGLTNACSGSFSGISIYNNLFFDLWAGAVSLAAGFPNTQVYNNTIYDFAKTTNPTLDCHGITSNADGDRITVRNNLIFKSNNGICNYVNRNSGWTSSNNLCQAGCQMTGNVSAIFKSTSSSSLDFLMPVDNGPARNAGMNLLSLLSLSTDYLGGARLSVGSITVGAIESAVKSTVPSPPQDVQIQ